MNIYALFWITASVLWECEALSPHKPPPLLRLGSHNWELPADEEVGTLADRLKVDKGSEPVTYSLESADNIHTFFRIDEDGRVFIAKPLYDAVGDHILEIRVTNSQNISSVTHIRVLVTNDDDVDSSAERRPPSRGNAGIPSLPGPIPFGNPGTFGGGSFNIPVNFGSVVPPPIHTEESAPPPLLTVDSYWIAASDDPPGTVVGDIRVMDLSFSGFNVSIRGDNKGLLHVDSQGGQVKIVRPLQKEVGQYRLEVVASSGGVFSSEFVTFVVQPSTPSPSVASTQTQSSEVPESSTKSYQDLRVIGNNVGSVGPLPDPSTTASPKEVSPEGSISLTVIPIVLVVGMSPLLLVGLWYWRRLKRRKERASAKESAVVYSEKGIEAGATDAPREEENTEGRSGIRFSSGVAALWRRRAESNKYEDGVKQKEKKNKRKISKGSSETTDVWEFPRHRLKIMGILGEGCFGQVWKCEANGMQGKGTMLVAVKTLKESAGERERQDLVQELKVLKSLGKHSNVVSLLGCCTEKDPIFVILEYMTRGKLQSYLRASRADTPYDNLHGSSSSLTPRDLIHFGYQISRGMEFLERNWVIHRDLAARNVLVGEDKLCKVADFGFARDIANNHVYERKSDGRLPIRWMAPESLYDNIFTTKSDVWSFGVLLWEIVTLGSTPYAGLGALEVMKKVREGYRLEKPTHCRREVYNIMYYCWDKDPKERPSFTDLVKILEGLLMSEIDYIELDRFPDHSYYNVVTENTDEKL